MKLKSTNYYVYEKTEDEELLLMSTLYKNYLKVTKEKVDRVIQILKSEEIIEYDKDKGDTVLNTLVDYGYLFDATRDESFIVDVMHKQHVFSDEWLYMTILPTNACNFRCVYCYETDCNEKMDDQTEKNILDFLEKNIRKYKKLRLNWFGGEPLLEKERVIRMSEKIDNICKKYHVPMIGLMSTNGYELDYETFEKLVKCRILSYQICLDGNASTHNVQRPHYKNSDSYEKILFNLEQIKKHIKTNTFKIGIRANMTPFVEEDLLEHLQRLAKIFGGDKRFDIYFQGIRNWGGERIKKNKPVIIEDEEDYYRKWYDIACDLGLNSAEKLEFTPVYGLCEGNMKNGYVVTFDGKIIKCSLAAYNEEYKDINEIGYISENGKLHIDLDKQAKWIVSRVQSKKCYECYAFPICCGGSCPYARNIERRKSCLPIKEMLKAHLRCMNMKGRIKAII